MLDITSSFVISSRLSTLDSRDILRIIHLAQQKWNDNQIKERMDKYGDTPIIGVGISNPQELSRVMNDDIPVIHIQDDCKSLQAVQKRALRNTSILNRVWMMSSASMWGLFGYTLINSKLFKRGSDITQIPIFEHGNIPIPNYIIGASTLSITIVLSWITKRILFNRIRNEYEYHEQDGECILYRNDVIYSKFKYFIRIIIPYWCIGLSVYGLKKHKRVSLVT